jgi:2-hydroxychromene-2-carboxylate isomerase
MEPLFYFDFGSPNAYLAHKVLPDVEARASVKFRYVPILLGGLFKMANNQSPVMAFSNIPKKLAYENREMVRFIKRYGVPFKMNPHFPVNTLALMRGAVAADAEGVLPAYADAMFHYMWAEPRKLDDMAVLAATLADAGLPVEKLMARAQDQEIKDRLLANTQAAFDNGAFGAPSFLVGKELFFGKNTLPDVEYEIARQRKAAG